MSSHEPDWTLAGRGLSQPAGQEGAAPSSWQNLNGLGTPVPASGGFCRCSRVNPGDGHLLLPRLQWQETHDDGWKGPLGQGREGEKRTVRKVKFFNNYPHSRTVWGTC